MATSNVVFPLKPQVVSTSTSAALATGTHRGYNASAGALTPTLPALSGVVDDDYLIVEKDSLDTSSNAVTVTCAGSDTTANGFTTIPLVVKGERVELQAATVSGTRVWKVKHHTIPKAGLDALYAPLGGGGGLGLGWLNATDAAYGAVGDCVALGDLTFTAGSTTIASAGSQFTAAMVGKTIALSQGKGTVQTATLSSAGGVGSTSYSLSAAITPGIYLFGTGATAELLHVRAVSGTAAPFTAYLGVSNTVESSTQARVIGDAVTRLDVHVTTITAVAGNGSTATLTAAPTATATSEYPRPSIPGGSIAALTTQKTAWIGTDNTVAFQKLATALPAVGGAVHLPPGRYLKTATITWASKLHLFGHGGLDDGVGPSATTQVIDTSPSTDGMLFQQAGCTVEDISFLNAAVYSSAPTAGAGLHFARATQMNLSRVSVISHFNNLVVDEGFYYNFTNCHFFDAPNYGLFFTTPSGEENDHGDQSVVGCVISMNYSTWRDGKSAVRWESGGGLRFTANKINGKEQPVQYKAGTYNYGLDLAIADYVSTVDILVTGGSIENCSQAGIYAHHKGPNNTGKLGNIIVTGTEIGYCGDPIDLISATKGNIYGFIATGNVFVGNTGGINVTGVQGVTVGANDWGIGTALMLYIGANTTDVSYDAGAQNVRGDFLTIVQDNTVDADSHGPFGNQRYDLSREILATTSTTTYTNLYSVTPPQYHGAIFEVVLEGNAKGVGPVVIRQRRVLTKGTGACVLTAIDTDVATDVAAGTQQLDFTLDTTSRSGDVIVRVRLKAGGTATDFSGRCYFKYDGPAYMIRKGS